MSTRTARALFVLLLGVTTLPVDAQGSLHGSVFVPESSQERAEHIGLRAHTNHLIHVHPQGGLGPAGGMTPAQMRSCYGMPSTGGAGVIAIVDAFDYPTALADFNTFAAQFGLSRETSANVLSSSNTVFQVVYQGGTRPRSDNGWNGEEALDIEWAHAMSPNAKIVLVEAQSDSFNDLLAAVDIAAAFPGVREVSMSWGGGEFSGENAFDSHFAKNGPLFFASSGDHGAPAIYPSSSPYVVSVGGTTVSTTAGGAFAGETGWSLSGGWGGGGGPSPYESKPSWQQGVANTGSGRSTPDISSDADPESGAAVYAPGNSGASQWMVIGGTSLSSPCMAAMVNVRGGSYGSTTALLTYIYGRLGTSDLRDITSGNNGYSAGAGYDMVTGVGAPLGTMFGSGGGGGGGGGGGSTTPAMTSPTPGSTLSGSTVTFQWSAGTGVTQYWLQVFRSNGSVLFSQNEGKNLSQTVTGLPTDGSTLTVRLWWLAGVWSHADTRYTAKSSSSGGVPAITSPTPGSVLPDTTVTFTWSASSSVSRYWLQVYDAWGDLLYSEDQGTRTSATVSDLPSDGTTVYVRLWFYGWGGWWYRTYSYTATEQ